MKNVHTPTSIRFNTIFWMHLFVIVLSWLGPFLFWWPLIIAAYGIVHLQFAFFGKCLMNEGHDLIEEEQEDYTFYAYLIETLGWQPNRKIVKVVVRKLLYIFLTLITILWQIGLGFKPLFF